MADIETLKIDDNNGSFIIINKNEFDANTQKEFSEKPVFAVKPASTTKAVSTTESK